MSRDVFPVLAASERLRDAFHFIDAERAASPDTPLDALIKRARDRFQLSPTQLAWVRWTLDPDSVALQSKQPPTPT